MAQKGHIATVSSNRSKFMRFLTEIKKHWQIYLLILLPLIWYIMFSFVPMSGLILAFKTYKAKLGIWGSPWAGFDNFNMVFRDPAFYRSLIVTFQINFLKLLITFPAPIVLALVFNEVRLKRSKKVLQTIFTFPHFLSWIIVAAILQNLLSSGGVLNTALSALGFEKINFMGNPTLFKPLLFISEIWKSTGFSAIVFMAAIAGVDQEQYEAAEVDGATRLQRIWHITLPSILPTISILLILQVGAMMSGNFDQIFNLGNAATTPSAETLDVYIYRITFAQSPDFGFSMAISLFRSVVNLALLLFANFVSRKATGNGIIGAPKA